MKYDEILKKCENLNYRDKLHLAQSLIQIVIKEEENDNLEQIDRSNDINSIEYITKRLAKLKPTKIKSLINSIDAMFQFHGGISDDEKEKIVNKLKKINFLKIENNKIVYLR